MITAMFKVLYKLLHGPLIKAFEKHLTTEDFTDIGVKPAPRQLTYYCMLFFFSNKPSFKPGADQMIFARIYLPFYLSILYLEVHSVPLRFFHKSQ